MGDILRSILLSASNLIQKVIQIMTQRSEISVTAIRIYKPHSIAPSISQEINLGISVYKHSINESRRKPYA